MGFEQVYNIIAGNVLAAVFFILWYSERRDRQRSDRRYRAVLRDLAELSDEVEDDNGHT